MNYDAAAKEINFLWMQKSISNLILSGGGLQENTLLKMLEMFPPSVSKLQTVVSVVPSSLAAPPLPIQIEVKLTAWNFICNATTVTYVWMHFQKY